MRALRIVPVLAAVLLAGCQASDDEPPANGTNAVPLNAAAETNAIGNVAEGENVTAKVLAMNDRQRNVVFIRAIMDAGLPCQQVVSSVRVPDQDGKPLWRANCDGGMAHMISITPDGTANIVSRTDR
ncbi:hypothetical protein AB2M62_02450 [Sphingomonas sp. MMS12-HWE2-04]|uniref:hypothetical protein n=1 Tax=Sphingomonas sp. MMS12-HWE2-04 TaxID=3234199 RepID=UPI00384F43E9